MSKISIFLQTFDRYGNVYYNKTGLLYFLDAAEVSFTLFTGLFESPFGDNEWYISGEKVKCSSQEEFERVLKLKSFL